MMKKMILAALAGATALVAAGSANAATATANGGLTFTVGAACTVSAATANMGNFTVGNTVNDYATRWGKNDSSGVTLGSSAPTQLASVTCPSGTSWNLNLVGPASGGLVNVANPSGTTVFQTVAYVQAIDANAIAGFINGPVVAGTGTGAAQSVKGTYLVQTPTSAQLSTAFVAGTYTGSAVATLTY